MATQPRFASDPRFGSIQLANGDSTNASASALAGVAMGTRVTEIHLYSDPTTTPGGTYKVAVLIHDGTNARVFDVVTLVNAVDTVQATLQPLNLFLPSASHTVRFQMRTQLTSGATLDCTVQGQDLT